MRNNQPVTNTEQKMGPNDILVSRTDVKGLLVYANKAFCDIAGYTSDELMGQPHNCVRHPDMPSEAFQDLWDTLSQEKPWSGLVKNRCANGDYYWVIANVSPEYDASGRVSGYISVRTAPDQATITATEALYRDIKAGKAKCPKTNDYPFWKRLKVKTLMIASTVITTVGLLWLGLSMLNIQAETLEHAAHRAHTVPYIAAVRGVLEYLPQHRGMGNAYLNGKTELAGKLGNTRSAINKAFDQLAEVDANNDFLHLTPDLNRIKADWKNLEMSWSRASATDSFTRHSNIINALMELASNAMHIGELTTTPDIHAAHYAEFIAESIPELNEYMGRLRGLGSGIAASGKITDGQQDKLLMLYVGALNAADGLTDSLEHVLKVYDPQFRDQVGRELSDIKQATQVFLDMVKHDLLDADRISIDANDYFAAGTTGIKASLTLFDAIEGGLSKHLDKQLKAEQTAHTITLISTIVLILLAIGLMILLMRKTFAPLQDIVDGMQRIIEGNYTVNAIKYADDELGDICDDMKSMQSRLQYEIFEAQNMAVE
ncbi:MAG: PAS domain-containing protein, partial [Mariprofundaceae bacterium]